MGKAADTPVVGIAWFLSSITPGKPPNLCVAWMSSREARGIDEESMFGWGREQERREQVCLRSEIWL